MTQKVRRFNGSCMVWFDQVYLTPVQERVLLSAAAPNVVLGSA